VCLDGAVAQIVHCGTITNYGLRMREDNGAVVNDLTRVDFHGRCDTNQGDSGGPVFTRTHYAGLITAQNNDNCPPEPYGSEGDVAIYSNMDRALKDLQLSLYTGD
jgi:hypothetical protein